MSDRAGVMRSAIGRPYTRDFLVDMARGAGGALVFSLPLLLTMEVWTLGLLVTPHRIALMVAFLPVFLTVLSRYGGLRRTETLLEDAADAFVAIAIASPISLLALSLLGLVGVGTPTHELVGKVAVLTVPGAIGAMLAQNQFDAGAAHEEKGWREQSYGGQIFVMLLGALFLSLSIVPTDEIVVLAFEMSAWHELATIFATLGLMHAFVYALELPGGERGASGAALWFSFLRYTVVGYAAVLLLVLYLLWTAGRFDGLPTDRILSMTVVAGLPGGLGAAIARLVL